ncbi:RNA polymerase II transcription elongation factor Rtf1p [Histoplasma ohiense]|nr:RNA polymerase II transcription elongation factor Rtf1p [Histoplasma ohiense (nom. inval.)]
MSDIDAEILALAGGDDSSDEEAAAAQPKRGSPGEAGGGDSGEESGEVSGRRSGKSSARTKRTRDASDKDDDGAELSSSSSRSRTSLRSASMSESDSDDVSPPPGDQGPIFPYEKLFYSAKDKAEVMALPEIQREELLSERAQQVDRHNQDLALRRLLASREREEARAAEKKKRKAGATDLEESQRKSSRQKTTLGGRKVGETSDAIEAYKRQREQKGKRDEQRRRDAGSRKKDRAGGSTDGELSDRDANGESDVEWDEGPRRRSPSVPRDDPPAELRDIQRARVGRSNFAQVCFYPGFDSAISNCYVRVVIGVNKESQQNEYRLCSIKKFTEGKPYAMEAPNGRSFITTQYAVLAHGKAEKEFPFIACSDSPITEAEFNRYRQTMAVEDCKMATKSMVANKVADINRLINHQFTKEELEEKLRRQGTNDNKMKIFERIQLEKRRQEAIATGDEAAIAQCDAELQRFTGPKLAFGTTLVKPRSTEKTQQERLQELNRRNQKLNAENVRRAQLEERRRERLAAAAVARGEAVANRFARVKTKARTHYDVHGNRLLPKGAEDGGGSDMSRPVTPITGANTPNGNKISTPTRNGRSVTPSSTKGVGDSTKVARKGGVPVIRHRPTDDENIAALDFEIDIEI